MGNYENILWPTRVELLLELFGDNLQLQLQLQLLILQNTYYYHNY